MSVWMIASCRLAERVTSPAWIVAAFGAGGALVFLGNYFSGLLGLWALLYLGITGSSVVLSALDALFLLCFLKVTADLAPATPVASAADPGFEPLIRIFLALMVFIGATFSLVPSGMVLAAALSGQSLDSLAWVGWLSWGIDGAIAMGFIAYAKLRARLPDTPPGLNLMTFGLVVNLGIAAVLTYASSGKVASETLMTLVVFGVYAGPFAALANLLLAIGLLKVMFNLAPPREAVIPDMLAQPSPPELLHVSPIPRAGPPLPPPSAEELAQAIAKARANLAAKPGDSMLHQQLHQRLLADPTQQSAMLDHAREYLAVLLKQSNGALALKVLQACLERDPSFKPFTDQVVPLAKIAMSSGQGNVALRIMNQFDRLNPEHAATPSVYFLSARALRDLKQVDQARHVLDAMLARYPDDPLAFDARALRKGLERP
jgi:hypothetical protein